MLPASGGTPEQPRLVGIQLESVGLHPAVHLINAYRQTLLDCNDHISAYHQHTNGDRNCVVQSAQLAQQCTT